jgi:hypothetical protein
MSQSEQFKLLNRTAMLAGKIRQYKSRKHYTSCQHLVNFKLPVCKSYNSVNTKQHWVCYFPVIVDKMLLLLPIQCFHWLAAIK